MSQTGGDVLYHYTDKKGIDGIKKTGQINQSTDGMRDAAKGPGVYMTDIPPGKLSKADTAKILYDDGTLPTKRVDQGRLDYVVKMDVDERHVEKVKPNVYLHRNKDLGVKDPSKVDPKKTRMVKNKSK